MTWRDGVTMRGVLVISCRVGENEDLVVESGLYNLTQEEAPILVHYGTDRVENWGLVRLENPEKKEPVN